MPSFVPLALALACGGPAAVAATPVDTVSEELTIDTVSGELTVFAAASLAGPFAAIGDAFTARHPDVAVTFSFAASSDLAGQILEGAPADVFASADDASIGRLDAVDPATFATNSLAILVEAGNPHGVVALADLADGDLIVVVADPDVPVGAYTQEVFANAGVEVAIASYERSVSAVAARVVFGEADAGIVYTTDVLAAGDAATGVEIPAELNVVAAYPIAPLPEARDPDLADAFVRFVLGEDAQQILAAHGFGPSTEGGDG